MMSSATPVVSPDPVNRVSRDVHAHSPLDCLTLKSPRDTKNRIGLLGEHLTQFAILFFKRGRRGLIMRPEKEELVELYEAFSIEEIEERIEISTGGCCCLCKCYSNER